MAIENELSLNEIYLLFPEINKNTISWRLHSLVQEGELYKTGHGFYSLKKNMDNKPIGYEYLQKKSKLMYDSTARRSILKTYSQNQVSSYIRADRVFATGKIL